MSLTRCKLAPLRLLEAKTEFNGFHDFPVVDRFSRPDLRLHHRVDEISRLDLREESDACTRVSSFIFRREERSIYELDAVRLFRERLCQPICRFDSVMLRDETKKSERGSSVVLELMGFASWNVDDIPLLDRPFNFPIRRHAVSIQYEDFVLPWMLVKGTPSTGLHLEETHEEILGTCLLVDYPPDG